jgi:uracil-DNA glycosylase
VTASAAAELLALQAEMRGCRRCQAAGFAATGPAVFWGTAEARWMLVGQAPAAADLQHDSRPWTGPAGRRLMGWLARAGMEERAVRAEAYLCALTRCYPGKAAGGRGDRAPGRIERELCAPYLAREIALLEPRLIVAIGQMAIAHFLGAGALAERIGRAYAPAAGRPAPLAWIVPLPHPSGASLWLNQPANQALVERALGRLAELKAELGI